ncbi:hypothetical protein K438DRAFT_2028076 [Mycena galopus ATCC 62051]|nr:hypothetical protein K438DRAFT_2028076 [Mycena galopus ATCC 62051]
MHLVFEEQEYNGEELELTNVLRIRASIHPSVNREGLDRRSSTLRTRRQRGRRHNEDRGNQSKNETIIKIGASKAVGEAAKAVGGLGGLEVGRGGVAAVRAAVSSSCVVMGEQHGRKYPQTLRLRPRVDVPRAASPPSQTESPAPTRTRRRVSPGGLHFRRSLHGRRAVCLAFLIRPPLLLEGIPNVIRLPNGGEGGLA